MPSIPFENLTEHKINQFKSKIIKLESGCWDFESASTPSGHKKFTVKRSVAAAAHRVSWQIFRGIDGLLEFGVLHKCDNPYCVNPDHLYLGTPKQNVDDMFNRNTHPTIIMKGQIEEIKQKYASGEYTQNQLAKLYDVTQPQISKIVNNRQWHQYA